MAKEIDWDKVRTRNFTCVVYPESAPENWLDILGELKIESLVRWYKEQ